MSGIA